MFAGLKSQVFSSEHNVTHFLFLFNCYVACSGPFVDATTVEKGSKRSNIYETFTKNKESIEFIFI